MDLVGARQLNRVEMRRRIAFDDSSLNLKPTTNRTRHLERRVDLDIAPVIRLEATRETRLAVAVLRYEIYMSRGARS